MKLLLFGIALLSLLSGICIGWYLMGVTARGVVREAFLLGVSYQAKVQRDHKLPDQQSLMTRLKIEESTSGGHRYGLFAFPQSDLLVFIKEGDNTVEAYIEAR